MAGMTFFLSTLGCKVNQYESQALREAWRTRGFREADKVEEADYILVNSCAVTAKAVADVRNTVRRLNRAAPGASIIVSGCAAQVLADELRELPGVVRVVNQNHKAELLEGFSIVPSPAVELEKTFEPVISDDCSSLRFPPFSVSGYDRSRAVLKIQDGCSHGCAYCIVPLTRGPARSRDFSDTLDEARRLLDAGFRELIISGVNLRQYRMNGSRNRDDFWRFLSLLDAALASDWTGEARLRISSLEPGQLEERALETLAACRLVAPHLHLSLQSGSPSVLQRMGRGHYDITGIPDFLTELRRIWPVFGLGADILTAFPGETETEFQEGLDFCRAVPFSYAHVFPYSKRPGTRAAALPGQIQPEVKKQRAAALRALVQEKKRTFLSSLLNISTQHVVFEDRPSGTAFPLCSGRGVNEFYAECCLSGPGSFSPAKLTAVRPLSTDGSVILVETTT